MGRDIIIHQKNCNDKICRLQVDDCECFHSKCICLFQERNTVCISIPQSICRFDSCREFYPKNIREIENTFKSILCENKCGGKCIFYWSKILVELTNFQNDYDIEGYLEYCD